MSHSTDALTITCSGAVELEEDDPIQGTYWLDTSRTLGHEQQVLEAMALAELCTSKSRFDSVDRPCSNPFKALHIRVIDGMGRLVLSGRVVGTCIEWCHPVQSDDEAEAVKREISELNDKGRYEHLMCDNYSTAKALWRSATALESRLVDPAWRAKARAALQMRSH